jgi:hypothetical protein
MVRNEALDVRNIIFCELEKGHKIQIIKRPKGTLECSRELLNIALYSDSSNPSQWRIHLRNDARIGICQKGPRQTSSTLHLQVTTNFNNPYNPKLHQRSYQTVFQQKTSHLKECGHRSRQGPSRVSFSNLACFYLPLKYSLTKIKAIKFPEQKAILL